MASENKYSKFLYNYDKQTQEELICELSQLAEIAINEYLKQAKFKNAGEKNERHN